jgi:MFS family permease
MEPKSAREQLWSEERWERYAPLAGVLAVILWIVGIMIVESADSPDEDAAVDAISSFFENESGQLLAGGFLFMLGSAALIWFLGSLRARFWASEGGSGRLAAIVYGSGLATAVLAAATQAPTIAGAITADETDRPIDGGAAEVFWGLSDGFFVAAETMLVVFFLAVALSILRTRSLPVWLGWLSLLLAVIAVIPWIGWAALVWGLPLFVLIAGIWMFVRPAVVETRAAPPPTVT